MTAGAPTLELGGNGSGEPTDPLPHALRAKQTAATQSQPLEPAHPESSVIAVVVCSTLPRPRHGG